MPGFAMKSHIFSGAREILVFLFICAVLLLHFRPKTVSATFRRNVQKDYYCELEICTGLLVNSRLLIGDSTRRTEDPDDVDGNLTKKHGVAYQGPVA